MENRPEVTDFSKYPLSDLRKEYVENDIVRAKFEEYLKAPEWILLNDNSRVQKDQMHGWHTNILIRIVKELVARISRLQSGNWTKEEIHNICHNLPNTVPLEEFAEGCRKEMITLYGKCPFPKETPEGTKIIQSFDLDHLKTRLDGQFETIKAILEELDKIKRQVEAMDYIVGHKMMGGWTGPERIGK